MKLIYAIVRDDNSDDVVTALNRKGYMVTRLATTGGFLRRGNTTLLIGTEEENVEDVIGVIRSECGENKQITVQMPLVTESSRDGYATIPSKVDVGGATIFVTNVERFEKF